MGARNANQMPLETEEGLVEAAWRAFERHDDQQAVDYVLDAAALTPDTEVLIGLLDLAERGIRRACNEHFPAQVVRWQEAIRLLDEADRRALGLSVA